MAVQNRLQEIGVTILKESVLLSVNDGGTHAVLNVHTPEGEKILQADALLTATAVSYTHLPNAPNEGRGGKDRRRV